MAEKSPEEEIKELIAVAVSPDEASKTMSDKRAKRASFLSFSPYASFFPYC